MDEVGAAHFYIYDLLESIKTTNVRSLNKNDIAKQVDVWENNVAVAESILNGLIKDHNKNK